MKNSKSIFQNLFVLELANNHLGSLVRGKKIISEYGQVVRFNKIRAAIKLQFRDVDNFIHDSYKNMDERYIKKTLSTKLDKKEYKTLVDHIKKNGCLPMATPFDEKSVDLCVEFKFPIIKIASSDCNDWPLIEKIASTKKPVIVSTGGVSEKDLDGLVFLAGAYWPMPAQEWDIEKLTKMININLVGALNVLDIILPEFISRDKGHLVFTGSLAGYRGLPGALGYGSSKAAIANLSETLYYDLRKTSIKVQLINPGFIKTRLTDKNDFKMPQIMSPEKAAEKMFTRMCKNRFSSSFPAPFSWLFRISRILPDSIYFRLF